MLVKASPHTLFCMKSSSRTVCLLKSYAIDLEFSKNKFIIVQTKPEQVLRSNQIDILLNTLQVNVIPYDYFSGPMNDAKSVLQLYGNDAFLIKTIQ